MAITSFTSKNNKDYGTVQIDASWDDENVNNYILYRKEDSDWIEIVAKEILSGYSVTIHDVSAVSGVEYQYRFAVRVDTTTSSTSGTISQLCKFDGIVISDRTGTWHTAFGTKNNDFDISIKKNTAVGYVNTLSGKYPHRIVNSDKNYLTGSVTGLFINSNDGCPDFSNATMYRDAFVEFLCNGYKKLLKTGVGRAYIVSIDDGVEEKYNAIDELTAVTFSWTQIGSAFTNKLNRVSPVWGENV